MTVNNDMSVSESAGYEHENNTTLNVVGEVTGDPQIDTDRPYIITITINSGTSISAIFDQPLSAGPAETASNYRVEDASGNTIDNPTNPVLGGSQSNVVTLTLGFTIQEGVDYFLIVNNVSNLNNQTVNANHRKRFRIAVAPVFYSRQSGIWGEVASWSRDSHSGGIADRIPGQSADQVVIGDNHTITISSSDGTVALQPLASVLVDATGTLRIADGGVLATGTRAVQGGGTFELEAGGTLQIGSPDGITAVSGAGSSSGNIRTAVRLFSEAAHYIYNGTPVQFTGSGLPAQVASFTLDNGSGVTLSSDLTVSGTLYLNQGVLTIPSGGHLVANDKQPDPEMRNGSLRFLRQITGSKGWRLMSSPVATDFADFVAGPQGAFTTQGFTGADLPNQMPNILHFAEDTPDIMAPGDTVGTNMNWRSITGLDEQVVPGRGYFIYIFDGAGGPDSEITGRGDQLPITISASGQENEPSGTQAVFDFNVSHTARQLYTEDSGWNLVGNPFGAALDWDDLPAWSRTNMHESIYVWDPSANSGNGEYRVWNGVTGSLGSGLIAPFQAFWVKAEDDGASLAVTADAKTTGSGESGYMGFVGRMDDDHADPVDGAFGSLNSLSTHHHGTYHHEIVMELRHLSSGFRTDSRLMFSPYGDRQGDSYDAYRLIPLTNTYLSLFTVREDGSQLAINSLNDRVDERFTIPMEAYGAHQGMPLGGSALLEWGDLSDLPDELSVMLHDTRTGETVNMRTRHSYEFEMESSPAFAAKRVAATNLSGHAMSAASAGDTSGSLSDGAIPDGGSRASGALAAGTGQQNADCSTGVTGADGRCENESGVIVNRPGAPFLFKQSSRPADTRFRILIDRRVPSQYGGEVPDRVRLDQNYPNPFNPGTTLRFALPEESRVRLAVYDVLGRMVAMPADGVFTAGVHEIGWEPRGLSSGTYIYRLEAGGQVQTRKMMLLK